MISCHPHPFACASVILAAGAGLVSGQTQADSAISIPPEAVPAVVGTLRIPDGIALKPYALLQTRLQAQYYDDEGLELSDHDNLANSGFAIPNALLGLSGTAGTRASFFLAFNAAQSGGALLNQAWFDWGFGDALHLRMGKFKTPSHAAYLAQIGRTLSPTLPVSLAVPVNVPFDLNAVNPTIATGFDVGAQVHGTFQGTWNYALGVFDGTGIGVNDAQRTLSDDNRPLPSLLYAARLAWSPWGASPVHQGDPDIRSDRKLSIAASVSYNVEAQWESSDDLRAGAEFLYQDNRLHLSSEAYLLRMAFMERQRIQENLLFWGAYLQAGWFVAARHQPALRLDVFDRNGIDEDGLLVSPAVGWNWYPSSFVRLQAMYQWLAKSGHENTAAANDDDNGMAEHQILLQTQLSF